MFIQKDERSPCSTANADICGLSFQFDIDLSSKRFCEFQCDHSDAGYCDKWLYLVNFTRFAEDAVQLEGQNWQVSSQGVKPLVGLTP